MNFILNMFLMVTTGDAQIEKHIGPIDSYGRTTEIKYCILLGDSHLYGLNTSVSDSLIIGRTFTTGTVSYNNTYIFGKLQTIDDK